MAEQFFLETVLLRATRGGPDRPDSILSEVWHTRDVQIEDLPFRLRLVPGPGGITPDWRATRGIFRIVVALLVADR
jgi:hypothetical protein